MEPPAQTPGGNVLGSFGYVPCKALSHAPLTHALKTGRALCFMWVQCAGLTALNSSCPEPMRPSQKTLQDASGILGELGTCRHGWDLGHSKFG